MPRPSGLVFLHIPATNSCCASIPRLYAYSVREFDGTDEVHSFPLDGRIVLFPADSEARTEENASLSLLRCEPAGTSMYRRSLGEETCCPV
jgi:hypothetical protein